MKMIISVEKAQGCGKENVFSLFINHEPSSASPRLCGEKGFS
jgi:hypothetical protein